jgi:hypothetical protein
MAFAPHDKSYKWQLRKVELTHLMVKVILLLQLRRVQPMLEEAQPLPAMANMPEWSNRIDIQVSPNEDVQLNY